MTVYPNVKVNLGLHVLRKRADGYHDLETLFIPSFSFLDRLDIEHSDRFAFEADVQWKDDLTVRAYRLLKDEFGLPPVRIRLEKHSPVGAGLGGGSADAAFALRVLNDMFSLGLNDEALASRAALLGSDCAFFIYNRPMLGSGRGEILEPFDINLSGFELRIHVPEGESVSTGEAYGNIIPREPETPLREILTLPASQWREKLENDFEQVIFPSHPAIGEIKAEMYAEGAVYASMSGSGPAVFGLFRK